MHARALTVFVLLASACVERSVDMDPAGTSNDDSADSRAGRWGIYDISVPRRTGWEILERARSIATVVLDDETLPSVSLADPRAVDVLENRAAAYPNTPISHRFELNDRHLVAWYLPSQDMLRIAAVDTKVRPAATSGFPDPGLGERAALAKAATCLSKLEAAGVIGPRAYGRTPGRTTSRVSHVPSVGQYITKYAFAFYPSLDGLPLQSAELLIEVNARSGVCQTIHVAANNYTRVRDARPRITTEEDARSTFESKAMDEAPADDIRIHGTLGYYLPMGTRRQRQGPGFVGQYVRVFDKGPDMSPVIDPKRGRLMDLTDLSAPLAPTVPDRTE